MLVWRAVGSFHGTEQEVEQKIQIYARCKRKLGNVDQCMFYWTTSLMGLISVFLWCYVRHHFVPNGFSSEPQLTFLFLSFLSQFCCVQASTTLRFG